MFVLADCVRRTRSESPICSRAFLLALHSHRSLCFALPLLFPLLALPKPLAKADRLAKKFENMRAVREPVQQRRREMFLSHHGIPISEFEIRGNDDRAAFVECRAELEEKIGPITTEGNEAKLIQDQEIVLTDSGHKARKFQLLLGGEQIVDQARHIVEAHSLALPTGG